MTEARGTLTPSQSAAGGAGDRPARYMLDTYRDWQRREGPPVHEGFAINLPAAETGPWPRLGEGCKGAFINLAGRGDWMTMFVLDIPPGGQSAPQRHVYDEVFFVLSGHGSTVVETTDGRKHTFEWGPRSLFAPPLNSRYRIFNGSGREAAKLVSTNTLGMLMNLFRSEAFIFDNPLVFPDREGPEGFYAGEGELTAVRPGRNLWETNFVADLGAFEVMPWEDRGAGSSNMQFLLTEGSIGAHVSQMPVGTYKKAHRHEAGAHVLAINGTGYTLFWYEGDRDFVRIPWGYGWVFAPPFNMFHQNFNTSAEPARYLAYLFGTKRYPIIEERRANSTTTRTDVSLKRGGRQIEYEDQDPRIHETWLGEMRANGVASRMGKYFDETKSG
ncbi:MAG: hypothetical protein RL477_1618 [Pseudomonadota bacterium]|jgi:oxalate decarboxylase/phosphoglucose isomerase-like protein (cupin superfamily)